MATRRRLMLVPVYAAFLQAILMIWEWWWCWMVMIVTMAMMLLLWLSSQRAESVFLYLSNNSSNVLKLCSVWYQQLVGAVLPPSLMVLWHCTIALCSYPHVKVSIIDLSQIFTTAPIFEQSHYFRQIFEWIFGFSFSFNIYFRTIYLWMAQLKTLGQAPNIFSDENYGENIWEIFAPRRAAQVQI